MHLFAKRHIQVALLLLIAVFVIGACGGGDDDEGGDSRPTIPSFPTTTQTTTPQGTGTQVASAPTPTLLPTSSGPTPTRFAGFPTISVPPTVPVQYPRQVQIVSPTTNSTIQGTTTVWGSASAPNFAQYTLEWGPDPNPSNLWYPITPSAVTQPVLNNVLGAWNTQSVPDGTYQIRIHMYLTNGIQETNVVVRNLQVSNAATQPPPPTNQAPIISPIAAITLERGAVTTVALGISDPDGDSTNFVATSDNTARVSVTPAGQAITLLGISNGVVTIRIRVIDARGAQTTTSFLVEVVEPVAPNNPPVVQPVPSQVLNANTTLQVPLTISDPDGDAFTYEVTSALPSTASVSSNPATQSINIAGFTPGSTTVTVVATDSQNNASTPMVFAVVVNPPLPDNNPPSIATILGQTLDQGQSRDILLSISDPDAGDTITYTAQSSDNATVSVQNIANNGIQITGIAAGSATITVTVSDNRGATTSTAFSVTVLEPPPPNQDPTIGTISDLSLEVNETVEIDLTLSDPDGDSLTFSATPTDASLLTTSQVDGDTFSLTGVAEGTTVVTVSVGDGNGGSASTTFNVTVNPATIPNQNPTIDAILDVEVEVGKTATVTFTASDPDNDPLTLFVNSSAPQFATVFQSGANELTISGAAEGTATITLEANDGRQGTASQTFNVTVVPANQNPTIDAINNQTCVEAQNIVLTVAFSDPDAGDTVALSVTSQQENIATVALNVNEITINCIAQGTATIIAEVRDNRDGVASTSFDVAVGAPNQNPTINTIDPLTIEVGVESIVSYTASDPDGDTLTVSPESDNNGVATVSFVQDGQIRVTGVAEGTATITLGVSDGNGGTATTAFGVTVNAATIPNQDPTISAIDPVTFTEGGSTTVTFTATDPDGDILAPSAVSDNEGIVQITGVSVGDVTLLGFGAGTANVTVTVDDGRGGIANTTFAVTVEAAPPTNQNPTIDAIAPATVEAAATTTVGIIVADPDGDPVTVTAASADAGIATVVVDNNSQLTVTGVAAGFTQVTVTVTDDQGGSATGLFDVTVNAPAPVNQNPTLGIIADINVTAGDFALVPVAPTDPDGDPVTITALSSNDGIASVIVDSPTQLTVTGIAAGNTTITVNADDGRGGTASTIFTVNVIAANQNPTLGPIADINITVGDVVPVAITPSDPDGDAVNIEALSANPAVASVIVDSPTQVTVTGVGVGQTQITINAGDGRGGTATTFFTVNVTLANQSPILGAFASIELQEATNLPVAVSVSDPDNNPVTVTASSSNPSVATVNVDSNTQLTVFAGVAGTATITVTADDGQGGISTATFDVTVNAAPPPNQNPVVGIINGVAVEVGLSTQVVIAPSDPDGNPITVTATSDNPGIATVLVDSNTQLTVTGVAEGAASITVNVNDDQGGTASTVFAVTVTAPAPTNQNPVLGAFNPLTINVGDVTPVGFTASDPDGNSITVTATSDNPGIATVFVDSNTQLTVTGVAAGTASITVNVNDDQGGTASTIFAVTVNDVAPPPAGPMLGGVPDVAPIATNLDPVFRGGGTPATSFSVAGDNTLGTDNFITPINNAAVTYGNYSNLQDTTAFYNFGVQSAASSDGWTPATLLDPAFADPTLCNAGETPLACELRRSTPSILFVTFSPSSATSLDLATFTQNLTTIVETSLAAGTVPVLALLPNDGVVTDQALLDQYNAAIVEVATNRASNPDLDIPVWDTTATLQGQSGGVYAASPSGPADFSDAGLAFGVNRRVLAALQILEEFRQTFP